MKPIHNPNKIAALPKKAAKISTKQSPVNSTPENSQKQPADKPQTTPSQPSWEPGHHPGGRPRKFTDPQKIEEAGEQFFKSCDEKKIPSLHSSGKIADKKRFSLPKYGVETKRSAKTPKFLPIIG